MLWRISGVVLASLSSVLLAQAQTLSATQWCDDFGQTNVCWQRYYDAELEIGWGYLFPQGRPPTGTTGDTNEFIGIFIAPSSVGWIGNSLGGGMRSNPLVVSWMNGSSAVVSVRRTESYSPPQPLRGPVATVLGGSGITSTRLQRIIYRCRNCTTWTGGSGGINLNGNSTFGFALHGSLKPNEPANATSSLYLHTLAGQHQVDVAAAKRADYWDILQDLQALPMLTAPASTTPTSSTGATSSFSCSGAPAPSYSMTVAQGWKGAPVLGGLTGPRGLSIDDNGHLLVLERGKGVTAHTLDGNGCVANSSVVIEDTSLNHGIDLAPSGDKLIASSSDIVWSWNYDSTTARATNKTTLITGMDNPGHTTRTVWISRKEPDYLLVSVGSDGNIDLPSFREETGRAQIRVFDMRAIPSGGLPYSSSGKVMGYGLRNDVGMAEDRNGTIHSVENSVDNAFRTTGGNQKDIHTNNPAEKVYRLGIPSKPTGFFGGYPYCYSVWEAGDFSDRTMDTGWWFAQAPNSTVDDDWCNENSQKPTVLLPPHTAPLDMKFGAHENDTNLYVSLHGSWNRDPPQGYKVVVVPGNFSQYGEWSPSGNLSATKTSSQNLLSNRNETECQNGCFRPVGLAFAHDGNRLYVSSDASGEVFLLQRDPELPPSKNPTSTSRSGTRTATATSGSSPTGNSRPGVVLNQRCKLKKK